MKKIVLGLAAASLTAGYALDASAEAFGDVARVLAATPLYERVSEPRRECRTEVMEERRAARPDGYRTAGNEGSGAGTVLGAIIGGVIGHQFGNSSGGRDRGTAAGTIVGGLVGNSVERDTASTLSPGEKLVERAPVTREVERCRDVPETRERLVGYDVRYEYQGREFRTRMPYDPGPQMPVNVDVRPPVSEPLPQGPRAPRYYRPS